MVDGVHKIIAKNNLSKEIFSEKWYKMRLEVR
jgi:hypothetical protein